MEIVDLKELALKKVKINGNVIGKFGTFEIEQTFKNNTKNVLEVGYTFPIVETATTQEEISRQINKSERTVATEMGNIPVKVPRDKNGEIDSDLVPKYSRTANGFDEKVISMYALGMSDKDIQEQIKETFGCNLSPDMISDITDKIIPEVQEWQKRKLESVYPKTEYQRCIVHQIRNSLKYVPYTERKELANDLKTVYKASTEELGYTNLLELEEKWKHKYPGAIQSWIDNWDVLSVFFKFSAEIRKIMYTTNAIESLNSTYKRINRNRNVFPTDMSLLKCYIYQH